MKFLGASELLQGRTDSNLGVVGSKSLILEQKGLLFKMTFLNGSCHWVGMGEIAL